MALKRLNKKLVIGLTLVVLATVIGLSALMLRQLQRGDPQHLVSIAKEYGERGEWKSAATFYQRAWAKSQDPAFLVPLGRALLEAGDVRTALQSWEEALRNRPDLADGHVQKLEVLLELARLYGQPETWRSVLEAADDFLALVANPAEPTEGNADEDSAASAQDHQAQAYNAKGLALLRMAVPDGTNREAGLDLLERAVELNPTTVSYAIDLANAQNRLGDTDARNAALEPLLKRSDLPGPDASRVHTSYASFLSSEKRWQEARGHLERAIELAKGDAEALVEAELALATTVSSQWIQAIRNKEENASEFLDESREILEKATLTQPESYAAHLHLAKLLKVAGLHEEAVQVCEDRLAIGLSRRGIKSARDRLHAFRLMMLGAESSLAKAATQRADDNPKERREWLAKAEQFTLDANGEFPDHPQVLHMEGRISLTRGMDRAALENLKKADNAYRALNRINWDNKLLLAQMHLRLSEPGAARALLEEVIDVNHGRYGQSYWSHLAQALFALNDFGPGLDYAIAQILLRDPDSTEAKRLRAAVLEQRGKLDQASELVKDSPRMNAMLRARRLAMDGDMEGAVDVISRALEAEPADPQLVGAAVNELMKLGRAEQARAIVDRAMAAEPDDRRLQRIAVMADTDLSPEDREQAMLEIIEAEPDAYSRAWELIAFYSAKGNSQEVMQYIIQAEQHLDDQDTPAARNAAVAQRRELLKAKLRAAMLLKDDAALESVRDSAARHNVDGAKGRSFLGLYHMAREEVDLAIKAFQDTLALQPTHVESMTQLAQCYHRLGKRKDATIYYEKALRINPNNGLAHKGLASLARERGDNALYEQHLRGAARSVPGDPWVQRQLLARQERNNPRAAITRRAAQLNESPDDIANLQQLARLAETINDTDAGDGYHRRLLDLQPEDVATVARASKYYTRTGRPDLGLGLLTAFAGSRATDGERASALLLVAGHHLAVGDAKLAESTMLQAADVDSSLDVLFSLGDFYLRESRQPKQALAWFNKAADAARDTESPRLAQVLSSTIACLLFRKVNDLEAARELVRELKRSFPNDPQGWLWESEVLARRGRLDEAISALSAYLEKVPGEPYAMYQRAKYYRGEGRLQAAIADLEAIKRANPLALDMEPRLLLSGLYRQAGQDDAWLRELESAVDDAPENARAVEQLVNAHIAEGRFEDADLLVTTQLNRGGVKPDGRWFLLSGRISYALDDFDKALADFHRGAAIDDFPPDRMMMILDVYLTAKRYVDGAEYYESHSKPSRRNAAVMARYARLLRAAGRDDDAVRVFREAMALATENPAMSVEAVIRELRQAYQPEQALARFEQVDDRSLIRANDRLLAHLYRFAKRPDDALAMLDRLIPTAQDANQRASLLAERGSLHQSVGRLIDARQSYEEAIKYDANNWILLNNVAYLLSDAEGNHAAALPYAQRAVDLANNPATLDTLGWIFVGLGRYEDAAADLSRAIRLDPDGPLAYYHLGETQRRQRRFVEAENTLNRGMAAAKFVPGDETAQRIDASLATTRRRDATP